MEDIVSLNITRTYVLHFIVIAKELLQHVQPVISLAEQAELEMVTRAQVALPCFSLLHSLQLFLPTQMFNTYSTVHPVY